MVAKRITTSLDEDKYNTFIENGGSIPDALNAAIDSHLNGVDVYYSKPLEQLEATLSKLKASREVVEARLEDYQGRLNYLNERISKLEKEFIDTEQHAQESAQSTRITQLLREINQAITYNEYKIPDIELAVKKQLKEIKKLQPDFTLEHQIAVLKRYNS